MFRHKLLSNTCTVCIILYNKNTYKKNTRGTNLKLVDGGIDRHRQIAVRHVVIDASVARECPMGRKWRVERQTTRVMGAVPGLWVGAHRGFVDAWLLV